MCVCAFNLISEDRRPVALVVGAKECDVQARNWSPRASLVEPPSHVTGVQATNSPQGRAGDMTIEHFAYSPDPPSSTMSESPERRTVASYERELTKHRCTEIRLREALAREEALLRQKDELIQQQEVLSQESDHRFLNSLQMIVSLLRLQSQASANAEAASQLALTANRVATIGRIHQRLHNLDGVQTVALKQYLEDLCRDFSTMLSSEEGPEAVIVVEGIEIKLPTVTGIPLAFIVNELITNAAKYGKGRIMVRLEGIPERATRCRSPTMARSCRKDLTRLPAKDWE